MNLKNPDLDVIRSILLECGYFRFMIRFWISPKKRKIRFWIQESVSGFSQKNAPSVIPEGGLSWCTKDTIQQEPC